MKQHGKAIGLASVYMIGAQLLCWLVSYISTKASDGIVGICLYLYLLALIPVYFIARGGSGNKTLFWCVALGCHVLFSVLSFWLIVTLDEHGFFKGWDAFGYLACWLYMVCFIGGALLLDLIILVVTKLVKRHKKRANEPEGEML